jgi:hypothetical protein
MNKLLLLYFFGDVGTNDDNHITYILPFNEDRWETLIPQYINGIPSYFEDIRWDRIFVRLLNE